MNTPDSTRVEVTPELLAEMEAVAQDRQAPARTPYEARVKEDNFRRVVNSRSVLALVERIRELESATVGFTEDMVRSMIENSTTYSDDPDDIDRIAQAADIILSLIALRRRT